MTTNNSTTTNNIDLPSSLTTTLQNELSSINRVSHKLAITPSQKLQKILSILLPKLLIKVGKLNTDMKEYKLLQSSSKKRKSSETTTDTNNDIINSSSNNAEEQQAVISLYTQIHTKLIEMLGHIMKRVRDDIECKLPCVAILDLLLFPEATTTDEATATVNNEQSSKPQEPQKVVVNPFTMNLSLAFVTLGINRCTISECYELLPKLLLVLEGSVTTSTSVCTEVTVNHLTDSSTKSRIDQIIHLIIKCLLSISDYKPMEVAATKRKAQQQSNGSSKEKESKEQDESNGSNAADVKATLNKTKVLLSSNPFLSSILFDLFTDLFLYTPLVLSSNTSSQSQHAPCNGLSTLSYNILINGSASESNSNCKNWYEEYKSRGSLRTLKLQLLDLIAPCRRYALFLSPDTEKKVDDKMSGEGSSGSKVSMGLSRTVALMVLLTGDTDPEIKSKAESYLKAHMDTYRGKDIPKHQTIHDALLGNSVALIQTLLSLVIGGASSLNIDKKLLSQYTTNSSTTAVGIFKSRLGVTYSCNNGISSNEEKKAYLTTLRMKMSEVSSTSILKFVSKMLSDNPKLFTITSSSIGSSSTIDMEESESDVVAISIGTFVITIMNDLHRPGSSSSQALEAASTLLNSLCVRLSLFYDARVSSSGVSSNEEGLSDSLERIRVLLAKSMKQACLILGPTSSGESISSTTGQTKASTTQIDIRDKCYGVVCTLSRSKFALDNKYALFNCGEDSSSSSTGSLTTIAAATLLFGCSSNEAEVMRPRATSALDALLGAYVRVVKHLLAKKEEIEQQERALAASTAQVNPWANITQSPAVLATEAKEDSSSITTEGLSRSLLPLLWTAARRNQPKSSRLASARWSSELLLRLDVSNAFHLLCFLSGDDDATVSMIAKQALGVDKTLGEDNVLSCVDQQSTDESNDDNKLSSSTRRAPFRVLLDVIIGTKASIKTRPTYSDFHVLAKAASIRFLLQSLFSEDSLYVEEDGGMALKQFVQTILETLAYYKSRSLSREETDLIDECSIALATCTSTSNDARLVVVKQEGVSSDNQYNINDIASQAVTSNSSKTRRHLAEVMGHLYEDHSLWEDGVAAKPFSISTWIECCGLANVAKNCQEKLSTMNESTMSIGQIHGAAHLGASCVRAFRLAVATVSKDDDMEGISDCWVCCQRIVALLGKGLAHADVAIINACSNGLVIAFSYDSRDAPVLDQKLFDSVAVALDSMNSALKKYSSIDHAEPTLASSLIKAAGLLLAASTSGAGSVSNESNNGSIDLGPARLQCTEALFAILGSAVYRKDDELSLIVGEALVMYANAWGAGEWSGSSNSEWKDGTYDEEFAFNLPPHRHVLYTMFKRELLSSNPQKKNACAATLLAFVGHASRMSNIVSSFAQRAFVKEIWKYLTMFQESFIKLLSDPKSKQLSRESCCKGLAACRGLAAVMHSSMDDVDGQSQTQVDSLNDELLKAFGQTTNHGGSMMQETQAQAAQRREESQGDNNEGQEETQVGGAAGMSEATLGAYREMASAALSLGKVDALYSLMILATNHPLWLTSDMRDRYSAKALLGQAEGSNVEEIRVSLRPHLGKLIPKLLRACNDPNKQTREQMSNLWLALSGGGAESRALITQNLLTTIDALIADAVSKLWRARVGACGALADIIVGRSWQDLGGGGVEIDDEGSGMKATASIRLLRLWRITMRALDDVRTAVRERGDSLGRGMRALTIRLCDPTVSDLPSQESDIYLSNAQRAEREKQSQITAEYAATVSLGWLVKYGLNQSCAEATGICISTLLGIVEVAKPSTLQPVLAELIGSLLMAMSGLEPAALNYLQVRTAGGNDAAASDNLERLRINMALSGPIAGALQKCLDMVKFVDLEAQRKLIPELDASLRKGAGFATRAATADAVGSLSSTCPAAFSFSGSTMANPTVRLLRALYFASERERGATAKDKMTHALGSLAELAPGKAVRILALKACDRYCESSGSNNDPSVRKAAAQTIRAIAVRASAHLADGGPRDIWVKKVLPTAFLGRHDKDAKVASLWKDVWNEGSTAIDSADRDDVFGVLLQEKLLPYIVKATVLALQSTSWANRKAGCAVLNELTDMNILAPTPRSTGEASLSTEDINRLNQRSKASSILLSECVQIISRNRIWDGKGDVVKAGTAIAGKWSTSSSPRTNGDISTGTWPLIMTKDCQDDLFQGDGWFVKNISSGEDNNDEVGCDDTNVTPTETEEDDTALDLSAENDLADDEQPNGENVESDIEGDNQSVIRPVVFSGFCKVLLDQALREGSTSTEGVLPYKASALSGLTALLKSVAPVKGSHDDEIVLHQQFIYDIVAPSLYSFAAESQTSSEKKPPLLIARTLECLAASMYDGVGSDSNSQGDDYGDVVGLMKFFSLTASKTPAWTVRQMSAHAAASLVSKMPSTILRKNNVITTTLALADIALKDKKFWKVRLSGLELLLSLVDRVGNQKVSAVESDKQLILESILPYKERIIAVARKCLADNESQVTAAASRVSLTMTWWP